MRWWDEWDDTALQTQDSKFELRWSEAEHGLSVTEVPHNIKYLQGSEELTLCLFETWMPEGGRTRDLYSHHRGYNDPFIAIVVSLYSHQSYRSSKMFYDNAAMLESTKNSMVDTTIIDVSQLNVLYIYCSSMSIKQPFCFHYERHLFFRYVNIVGNYF